MEVISQPYNYFKYANVSHTMMPTSFIQLLTEKVQRFFSTWDLSCWSTGMLWAFRGLQGRISKRGTIKSYLEIKQLLNKFMLLFFRFWSLDSKHISRKDYRHLWMECMLLILKKKEFVIYKPCLCLNVCKCS